jgi:hypothetical protein
MNSREYRELQEAYFGVYDIDEVTGFGGHINPQTGKLTGKVSGAQNRFDSWRSSGLKTDNRRSKHKTENPHNTATTSSRAGLHRGSAAWNDQNEPNLSMTPVRRAELAAKRAERQGEGKRANKIRARISGASEESQNESYDIYDIILSHLLDEGYADTLEAAEGIMVSMSEEWREEILDESIGSSVAKLPDEIRKLMRGKPRKRTVTLPPRDEDIPVNARKPDLELARQKVEYARRR